MEKSVIRECEQSFYKTLYHLQHPGQDIVIDRTTEHIWLQKKYRIYNSAVYTYLKEHPNPHIPFIQALWENTDKSELTVVEQLVQGETLDILLARNSLSSAQKIDIALQLCDALLFLHGAVPAIIHRDIKGENIAVERDGNIVLLDYNAAKQYRENETRDTTLLGTEGSAAPEQYGFRQSDARTDIYGLGVLLREMFPDDPKMLRIADKATQMDPDKRYQSAAQLRRAIQTRCGRVIQTGSNPPSASGPEPAGFRAHSTGNTGFRAHDAGKPLTHIISGTPGNESAPFTLPISGFRSGNPRKMILAAFGFLLIIYFSVTLDIKSTGSSAELWLNRICFLCMCLSCVDLFTDWSHLYRYFPFMRSSRPVLRIVGYCIALAFILFFWVLVTNIFSNIL